MVLFSTATVIPNIGGAKATRFFTKTAVIRCINRNTSIAGFAVAQATSQGNKSTNRWLNSQTSILKLQKSLKNPLAFTVTERNRNAIYHQHSSRNERPFQIREYSSSTTLLNSGSDIFESFNRGMDCEKKWEGQNIESAMEALANADAVCFDVDSTVIQEEGIVSYKPCIMLYENFYSLSAKLRS